MLVRSRPIAEEIVQDVMFELWKRRETMEQGGSPQAYLFRATRNRALNHIRHERVEREGEQHITRHEPPEMLAHSLVVQDELAAAVERAVANLPGRCREVFELSRRHGLKYAEIATVLGISIKTVEAQMGNALRKLREELTAWLPEKRDL